MDNLQYHLEQYIQDPRNDIKNFNIGKCYDDLGHIAGALSFYLRTAELTDDPNLAYACLLRNGINFKLQGKRDRSTRNQFLHAISLMPTRPEAYYLLARFYQEAKEYHIGYTYAEMGLKMAHFDYYQQLLLNVDYPGKYGLYIQKAVCAWWIDQFDEARSLFKYTIDNHWDEMTKEHRDLCEWNLMRLGVGPDSQSHTRYNPENYPNLRFKFNKSETIKENYSQVYQDMFVLSMLDGKENGTFLEVGGAKPYYGNNTALLEQQFGWRGVSIEFDESLANEYKEARPEVNMLCTDALGLDYSQVLNDNFDSNIIDYLQLDIEPHKNTYECLLKVPFDTHKFRVITYEHDYYIDGSKSYRGKSRKFLEEQGYIMVIGNLSPDGKSCFEDWWVHPELVDPTILSKMKYISSETIKAEDYILDRV